MNNVHKELKPKNLILKNENHEAYIKIFEFILSSQFSKKVELHAILGTDTLIYRS